MVVRSVDHVLSWSEDAMNRENPAFLCDEMPLFLTQPLFLTHALEPDTQLGNYILECG